MTTTTAPARLPVTVLSGFLGAGKTTRRDDLLADVDRLISPQEITAGKDEWRAMPDPFPAWHLDDLAEAHEHQH